MSNTKPLGVKNYGSIGHLPNSRLGPADHSIHEGQARICCEKARDKHDRIIVTEKLDGSNVGIARIGGQIVALGRAGYLADTSPYRQHQMFAEWVKANAARFAFLAEGDRVVGEWLAQAHGTRYSLEHEPLVLFDMMRGTKRAPWNEFLAAVGGFVIPHVLSDGPAISVEHALLRLGQRGYHGASDAAEGVVYRVERNGVYDFMAKYVRPEKIDGCYLPERNSTAQEIWNWQP